MNPEHARTISILKEMANGKTILLGDYTYGMCENMSIGVIAEGQDGQRFIMGLSTMDLMQFNALLNRHGIGVVIPDKKGPRPEMMIPYKEIE